MSMYRDGTIARTTGSKTITGTGTLFVAAVNPGDAIFLAGVMIGEVDVVVSNTVLNTVETQSGTGSGLAYAIQQTPGPHIAKLAPAVQTLVDEMGGVRDNAGAGRFGDGSAAAPALRALSDLDTGFAWTASGTMRYSANGTFTVTFGTTGLTGAIGASTPSTGAFTTLSASGASSFAGVTATGAVATAGRFTSTAGEGFRSAAAAPFYSLYNAAQTTRLGYIFHDGTAMNIHNDQAGPLIFDTSNTERARIDASGNFLVGAASGSWNIIQKPVTADAGNILLAVNNGTGSPQAAAVFYGVSGGSLGNAANAAVKFNKDATTLRSIGASGTGNFSGSDYAEYMRKAVSALLQTILKGQVCGIDAGGRLTLAWSAAHSYVLKSTDPSLVGGDTWSRHLPPQPTAPADIGPLPMLGDAPATFDTPQPERDEGESDSAFTVRTAQWLLQSEAAAAEAQAFANQVASFPALLADWNASKAAFDTAQATFEAQLAIWEAALQEARGLVDRIAFSGQVPAIVTGDWAPGDYLVATEGPDDSIAAVAIGKADMAASIAAGETTYLDRLGKIWAVTEERSEDRDGETFIVWPAGMAWVDVQHG
ncbi:MAG: hypothetical protein V4808_07255 [Pseudomonadota bacterium]